MLKTCWWRFFHAMKSRNQRNFPIGMLQSLHCLIFREARHYFIEQKGSTEGEKNGGNARNVLEAGATWSGHIYIRTMQAH